MSWGTLDEVAMTRLLLALSLVGVLGCATPHASIRTMPEMAQQNRYPWCCRPVRPGDCDMARLINHPEFIACERGHDGDWLCWKSTDPYCIGKDSS